MRKKPRTTRTAAKATMDIEFEDDIKDEFSREEKKSPSHGDKVPRSKFKQTPKRHQNC
jgi:hypothetical protein